MKLDELNLGQIVQVDDGFTCMPQGTKEVKASEDGTLFLECTDGRHYLDGQIDKDGDLIGITPVA